MGQNPIDEIVGARVAAIRTAQDVHSAQLASILGTTENHIARYESGAERISAAHLIAICQFFKVKLEDIFPDPGPNQDSTLH